MSKDDDIENRLKNSPESPREMKREASERKEGVAPKSPSGGSAPKAPKQSAFEPSVKISAKGEVGDSPNPNADMLNRMKDANILGGSLRNKVLDRDEIEMRRGGKKKPSVSIDKKIALSLRYQVPKKLKDIPKDKLKKLATYITDQVHICSSNRTGFFRRLEAYRENWKNFDSAGLRIDVEGQHNEHVPVIYQKGKTLHARLYQAVLGIDPIFSMKPKKPIAEKVKQDKEDLLRYILMEYYNHGDSIVPLIDDDIRNYVFDGTSIVKHFWTKDVRKFVDIKVTPVDPPMLDENGQLVVEEEEIEKESVVYDGPSGKVVSLEDLYIVGQNAETIDSAEIIAERQLYTKSQLIKLAKLGFFFEDAIAKLVEKSAPVTDPASQMDKELKQQQERIQGERHQAEGQPTYTIFESYLRWDIDDDGIDEELVAWVDKDSNTIIRLTYLDRISPNGKRPYVLKKLIPVEGSPYGIGFAEMLNGINNLIDYVANQRLDAGTFQTFPWFVFRATSGMQAGDIRIAPGKGIPVDDVNQIAFPRVNGNVQYGFNEESLLGRYGDKVTGVTEFAEGVQSGQQGIARTATGAASLVQELNTNLDIYIKRFQLGFKKSLKIIDKQVQELLPLGFEYQVLGADKQGLINKRFMDRKAIAWDSDYDLAGNSVNSNKAIERDTATQIIQTQLNPVVLQSGLVGPKELYNGLRNFFQKLEIRDIPAYVKSPDGIEGPQFSALDEINMIVAGVKPPIVMNDKHMEKLAVFDQFEQSPEFGFLTTDHMPIYAEIKQAHQNFADAIAAQAPLAANTGGAVDPALAAQIASGSGAPQGIPQQLQDLLPESSPANNQ